MSFIIHFFFPNCIIANDDLVKFKLKMFMILSTIYILKMFLGGIFLFVEKDV